MSAVNGMDTQHVLPDGTEAEVRRIIDALAGRGMFISANMHMLMEDVPVRNVLAWRQEVHAYRPGER